MNKKKAISLAVGLLAIIIAGALALFPPTSGGGTYDNLIVNGDFEALNGEGLPVGWYTDAYFSQGRTEYALTAGRTGNGVQIINTQPNDARFAQAVPVSPDTLYRLHGYVKGSAEGGRGANVSVEGVGVFSNSVYEAEDGWQEVALYGRTGEKQRSLTVFVRLGGYSGEATGDFVFDDITLCRVDSVPAGWVEQPFSAQQIAPPPQEKAPSTGAIPLLLTCLVYGAAFALLLPLLRPRREEALLPSPNRSKEGLGLALLLTLGLALRLLVAAQVPGYDVDMNCFRGWASEMAKVGPANFYQSVSFCDYPPGYLWVLWGIGGMGRLLGGVSGLMVKLPPILADLVFCALLYTQGRKHGTPRQALALCALYAFNPLVLVTGAAWGQTDSLMTLMLVLTVLLALKGQWKGALPLYVAAALVKPQALMFGPLGLTALGAHLWKGLSGQKDKARRAALRKDVFLGLGLSLITLLVMVLPFSLHQSSGDWLISLYGGTMSQYGYATVNACNLYFLLGKNWVGAQTNLSGDGLLPLIAWLVSVLPLGAAALLRTKEEKTALLRGADKPRLYLFGGLSLALGVALLTLGLMGSLTYSSLGVCMIVYAVAAATLLYLLGNDPRNLPLLGAALLLMLFNTGAMMHERYLFPAAGLLFMGYLLKKDKRMLYLALAVTLTGFLNIGCALDRNIRISGAAGHLSGPAVGIQSDLAFLEYAAAAGNCLLSALSLTLCACLCRRNASPLPITAVEDAGDEAQAAPTAPLPSREPLRKMTRKDWLILLTATVAYAALALTNLGSTKAPQTAWISQDPGEQLLIDLGQDRDFTMLYYMGIHWQRIDFTVETSQDGVTWDRSYQGGVVSGSETNYTFDCFSWRFLSDYALGHYPTTLSGRFVRLTANQAGLTLFEALFRDEETGEVLPISSITDSLDNETYPALIDEQDTLAGEPGWYNSTYFDEIYHARTAYEHLHGLPTYETTHPPLGKVLMSLAISVFGMTPFGWRFAGAMAGVLMLPGMYLLGKLLIRRRWGGLGALGLMALDLMHFTQTRIATIDSFVVLFILWSFYFMLRWFLLDFFETPLGRTFLPLGLSGLFMGLAVASKWTGCYAGVGLAVIFFLGIYRRYRLVRSARKLPKGERSAHDQAAAQGGLSLLLTVLSCLGFFIAVPLMIYYLSYIPYFAFNGGVTVQKVIEAAVGSYFTTGQMGGMLGYHATPGLGMDHGFYSPWYQWPVIAKPMWYFNSAFEPAGLQSTILAMGNPAVWWTGLVGLVGVMGLWLKRHLRKDTGLCLYAPSDDPRYALVLIFFAAQFLPWMLVPRGTYIYHYFPSVPLIILCTLLCLDKVSEKWEKAARWALIALLTAALVLFIAFFPYASGLAVPQEWLDRMKWFPHWLYY